MVLKKNGKLDPKQLTENPSAKSMVVHFENEDEACDCQTSGVFKTPTEVDEILPYQSPDTRTMLERLKNGTLQKLVLADIIRNDNWASGYSLLNCFLKISEVSPSMQILPLPFAKRFLNTIIEEDISRQRGGNDENLPQDEENAKNKNYSIRIQFVVSNDEDLKSIAQNNPGPAGENSEPAQTDLVEGVCVEGSCSRLKRKTQIEEVSSQGSNQGEGLPQTLGPAGENSEPAKTDLDEGVCEEGSCSKLKKKKLTQDARSQPTSKETNQRQYLPQNPQPPPVFNAKCPSKLPQSQVRRRLFSDNQQRPMTAPCSGQRSTGKDSSTLPPNVFRGFDYIFRGLDLIESFFSTPPPNRSPTNFGNCNAVVDWENSPTPSEDSRLPPIKLDDFGPMIDWETPSDQPQRRTPCEKRPVGTISTPLPMHSPCKINDWGPAIDWVSPSDQPQQQQTICKNRQIGTNLLPSPMHPPSNLNDWGPLIDWETPPAQPPKQFKHRNKVEKNLTPSPRCLPSNLKEWSPVINWESPSVPQTQFIPSEIRQVGTNLPELPRYPPSNLCDWGPEIDWETSPAQFQQRSPCENRLLEKTQTPSTYEYSPASEGSPTHRTPRRLKTNRR